ncbi:sigma-70 family RNA polymerase sigma factor [Sphingobacterium sp. DK4209]|uniref:Sigma-70 family RNA polymerase sigma factor n=1 Tax=Sphingobacterium zhuxiongii TaxID=2662364 RepID=A0A5Q0QFI6_9SPHI|nr:MULTISPECIES: sigma-70 family RNA polymerase sigma factor [unclassified Sphingobacterium]MVZ66159.1 sigma-70 family RNA polymerase sigma factor [Sphingobacterium sp. DK4209]QGA26578.1 sigma-70 family RNA polymerase sigma factor [Sphingobacterium sp. dk4302]
MQPTARQFSEADLLTKLKDNQEEALIMIYNQYWDRLYFASYNLLENTEEAEECVQNVFVSLWKRRATLDLNHSLLTYLSVAVKYQSINCLARINRRKALSSADISADYINTLNPEQEFIAKELFQKLSQSINNLPTQCRVVYKMRAEEGLTVRSISEQLGISDNTVKMHLKNANKKLRKDLLIAIPVLISLLLQQK